MSQRTRTILFGFFVALFLIATPIAILISRGYIFDFPSRRFVQTGAIFLKTSPQRVILKFNGDAREIKPSGILYDGILIRSLVPKRYRIEITDPQNQTIAWRKDLDVVPLIVAKATRIAFPPPAPQETSIPFATATPAFLKQANERTIFFSADNTAIFLLDLISQATSKFADLSGLSFVPIKNPITDIRASKNLDQAIIQTGTRTVFFFNNAYFDARQYLATFMKNENVSLENISFVWHPERDTSLFLLTTNAGYLLDVGTNTYQQFSKNKVAGLVASGSGLYYAASSGIVYQILANIQTQQSVPVASLAPWTNAKTFWDFYELPGQRILAHSPAGPLVMIDLEMRTATEISARADIVRIAPDQKRIAYTQGQSIFGAALQDLADDTLWIAGQTMLLARTNDRIQNLFFINDTWYVAAAQQTGFLLAEFDNREPVNTWFVAAQKPIRYPAFADDTAYWISGTGVERMRLLNR